MSPSTWFRTVGLCGALAVLAALPDGKAQESRGKKYALLVGVTEYKGSKFGTLKYTENDVEKLAEILNRAGFDKVRVLTNTRGEKDKADAPTAANVKKAIEELCEDRDRRDTVLVALCGHGANVKVEDPDEKGAPKTYACFCPYDASLLGISYSTGRSKFLVNLKLDLFDKLEECGARAKLVLIDACRNEFKADAATRSLGVEREVVPGGVSVLFSCSKDEVAWESGKLKHGVFFHFVLEGLRGEAANKEGEVTWPRLTAYVTEQVERQVGKIVGGGASQTPHALGNVRGAPLLVPAGKRFSDSPGDKGKPSETDVVKGREEVTNSVGMKFVRVRKGAFTMGSPEEDKDRAGDEKEHAVEITKDFFLGVHEVTQKHYRTVTDANPSYFSREGKGKAAVAEIKADALDRFPVENVSFEDVEKFIRVLNALEKEKDAGRRYRLPTEAEWEYACRAAGKGYRKFHTGDRLGIRAANFGFFAKEPDSLGRTREVGSYPANAFGLFDMHGNVAEWCADWYERDYYKKGPRRDPPGPERGFVRVIRGGSWNSPAGHCRSAYRADAWPGHRDNHIGFRLALDVSK